jgi:hypothetical protein
MEFQKFSITPQNSRVIESFGRCIYCGSDEPPLFREHVIPRGIGGALIILRASCTSCADITKRFEQSCLRTNFGHHRLKTGFKSYHKSETPDKLPIKVINANKIVTEELPLSEHPFVLYMPRLRRPPRLLRGMPPKPIDNHSKYIAYAAEGGIKNQVIFDLKFDFYSFYRLLAKIAHGFAVSHFGLDNIEPFLTDIIINNNLHLCTYYIGRNIDIEFGPKRDSITNMKTFELNIRGLRCACVTIQLFANICAVMNGFTKGTPIYLVLVGQLK